MGMTGPCNSTGHLWTEEGEQRTGMVAEVAPLVPGRRTYTFTVPKHLEENLRLGQRVKVPLGRGGRLVTGFILELDRRVWDSTLRPIDSVLDEAGFLTPDLRDVAVEISEHYACSLGAVLKSLTPVAARRRAGFRAVRYAQLIRPLTELAEEKKTPSAKRVALLEGLKGPGDPIRVDQLLAETKVSAGVLRSLVKEGWLRIETRREIKDHLAQTTPQVEPTFSLNPQQQAALKSIEQSLDEDRFRVTLLYGVSGSGKTEVYIRAMQRVTSSGRQAILLVPEIVLTTQIVGRLSERFADVAVNHSGLTDAQRSVIWHQIASGEKKIIIGTRSAAFAPCPDLGLICVDEEQETSYKNLQAPRFNVRDVAIMRAKRLGIPVVLGSATPSVETWYHSEHRSDYTRVSLHNRVRDLPMPKVHVVDMRDEYLERKKTVVVSRLMERLLHLSLERKEQALLLMNRRGFANRTFCPSCRTALKCPNCNVSFVVHSFTGSSMCHYCRTRITTPTVCPNLTCGAKLIQAGMGTQRVEEVLISMFPKARIRRVDSDTMKHRDQYQQLVDDFSARKIDVLVGTQMIAKGLDFPFVSFVGVMDADAGALAGDFRAQERLFQLLTQVAGRAGRADALGNVVVQTATPNLPALRHALEHDYESFVAQELPIRQRVGMPPFRRMARIILGHASQANVRHEAEVLSERIREIIAEQSVVGGEVLGPNPCVLSRLRGMYRYDLLLLTPNASLLRGLLAAVEESKALRTKAQSLIVDVDPVALS